MVRTGILFLVLQSLLLCATVQAEPGFAKSSQSDIASVLQTSGSGDNPCPDDTGGDGDLLDSAVSSAFLAAVFVDFNSLDGAARSARYADYTIRGPPAQA